MKFSVLTYDFYPFEGGQGKHIYEIYYKRILERGKCDTEFISPCQNEIEENKTYFGFTKKFGRNILYSILINLRIKKIVKENGIARLNVHCGPGGVFLIRKLDVPVIATCHHTYWQQSHYIKSQFWKRIFIALEKRTYKLADKIICVSEDTKGILTREYGVYPDKIAIIPNGVDDKEFHPIKNIEKIPKSVLYVGRVDKRKGVDFLIKSVAVAIEKDSSIRLFIGGEGKDLKRLKRFVLRKNLRDNIEFLGFIPEDRLNEWYNKAECVVVPSAFEGFGVTVIEAMASGTPVIATNADGLRCIIKNNKNGVLVEYNNKEELANQIVRLLDSPSLRKEFSSKGLKTIKKKFDWNKIALKTLDVYENVKD